MVRYFRSMQGRLLALAMALPLLGGAAVALTAVGVGFFTFPLVIGICLAFVAVGLSLEEYPGASITAILTLPPALFVYVILVGIVAPQIHGVAYAMAAGACTLLAIAAMPRFTMPAGREARVTPAHAT